MCMYAHIISRAAIVLYVHMFRPNPEASLVWQLHLEAVDRRVSFDEVCTCASWTGFALFFITHSR